MIIITNDGELNECKRIISSFGGLVKMSKVIDVPVSTIQYWGVTNKIPSWREGIIQEKAKTLGINLANDNTDHPDDPADKA